MKPKVTSADQQAYDRIKVLAVGTPLTIAGRAAKFHGMTGHLLTIKPRSGKTFYLRAGDQIIKEITHG